MATGTSITTLVWHPEVLTAKLRQAFPQAAADTRAVAARLNPAPNHIKVVLSSVDPLGSAVMKGTGGLAHIFEGGRKGGYPIQPGVITRKSKGAPTVGTSSKRGSQVAIKFTKGNGGFYRGPGFLGGPMSAHPFIHPAAALFPALYRRRAVAAMVSLGSGLHV